MVLIYFMKLWFITSITFHGKNLPLQSRMFKVKPIIVKINLTEKSSLKKNQVMPI